MRLHIIRFFAALILWLQFGQTQADEVLSATITRVKPSIVVVGSFQKTRTPRGLFLGTGFAIGDGTLIATNAHVIAKEKDLSHKEALAIFVRRDGKEEMAFATELKVDPVHDIAVLKLAGNARLTPMVLGDAGQVKEGQDIAFTGFPIGMVLGLYPVTHQGIISAISPTVIPQLSGKLLSSDMLKRLREPYDVFQLDATAYPGNSGSPLYDPQTGSVIGIINKVFVQEGKESAITKPSGITYAMPVTYLKKLLDNVD
ncbi:serine protease [Methylicorpusculum oleiharenae]|uniref:S1 family peptidase n=1 Tax=Methylicorpusculum oleiharenae TaxID=1338687 RepID=UPI0013576814|nr:serine protease [Methylicorpusculum oleiharenae]MCD2451782.1 serine protease [Methylicorpusculum oleiharenae]